MNETKPRFEANESQEKVWDLPEPGELGKPNSLRQAQAYAAAQHEYAGWLDCLSWLLGRDYISPQVCQEAREAGKKELG